MKSIYILLATYNGEEYLKEQLDSLFKQTYKNWILWIHDDNSKDNTVSIIKDYKSKYPDKVKFLDDDISNGGAKENFTYLLKKIDNNYDYIMFCDQDDVWLNDKIEITLEKMLELENDNSCLPILIHTDLYIYENEKKNECKRFLEYQKLNYKYDKLNRLFMQNIVTGCTMMINKNGIEKITDIPKEALMHDWWAAIVISAFGKIGFIDKPTVLYRQHDNNTVGAKKRNLSFFVNKIFNPIRLNDNFLQIHKFKTLYNISLDEQSIYIIDIFLSLQKESYLKSRYLMFKHKIYKHGIIRNIALFMGIVKS